MCAGSCSGQVPSRARRVISMPACMRRRTSAAVYDEVLRRARSSLSSGYVGDLGRHLARCPAARACPRAGGPDSSPIVELTCSVPLEEASARIQSRRGTTSDATPQIAAELAEHTDAFH